MNQSVPYITAAEVERRLDYPSLIEALCHGFAADWTVPMRQHYGIPMPAGEAEQALLLMPAWEAGAAIGVKMVTVTPGNGQRGLPAVQGVYLLLDGRTGVPQALIDGPALTVRRTAAASALAARHLARKDAAVMLMAGTGALARPLVEAHATQHKLTRILIWGRDSGKARAKAAEIAATGLPVVATDDLETAVRAADIVTTATLSTAPLIRGAWLKPGTHLDLVGAYTKDMRESDDEAVLRATLFVDTKAGALKEAGDIIQPLHRGLIAESAIAADLFDLCRGRHPGRRTDGEITLFKSVGTALEDLAAARLINGLRA